MSRSVRLPEYLALEVERLAGEEKRSLANMVQVLLEQALRFDTTPVTEEVRIPGGVAQFSTTPRHQRHNERKVELTPDPPTDLHFKPDFKK